MSSRPLCKILLVDDDPALLRIVAALLKRSGYIVETAADGNQALEKYSEFQPNLLITDWMMPGKDGIQLIRELNQSHQSRFLYSILLTARSAAEDLGVAFEAGANDFINKPVSEIELLGRVRNGQRIVELENTLRQLSENDGLTNVLNRRTFHNQMMREWARAERYELPLSVVVMDVDFFKRINDEYGHPAGDAVLVAVSARLRDSSRPSDYVCRYGGEEFVVLLPQTDEEGAHRWADRVRGEIESTPIVIGDREIKITASFGVAEKLEDVNTPDALVDHADQGLLIAKRTGRNRTIRFSQLQDLSADPFSNIENAVHPLDGVLARDVMSTLVMTLNTADSVLQAVELVLQMRLPSVPVTDVEGKLAGIISEKDLMLLDVARDGWSKTVGDVMKTNVVSYDESTPAKEVFDFLCRVSIRRVVVVSQGQPVGMLSRDTYLRWYCNWLVARGLSQAPARDRFGMDEPEETNGMAIPARDSLLKTAWSLLQSGQVMVEQLQGDEDLQEMVPYIVGGATRMQDLATDLLGHCQQIYNH